MRWSHRSGVALLLVLLLAGLAEAGATSDVRILGRNREGGTDEWRIRLERGEALQVVTDPDGTPVAWSTVSTGIRRVIVEIAAAPIASLRTAAGAAAIAQEGRRRRTELARVAADVVAIEQAVRRARGQAAGPGPPVVRREFVHVLTGLAATVSPEAVVHLRRIPGVVRVSPDVRVRAFLRESVPLIRADRVWTSLGATGRNVKVAIVDTGVNYAHPDLGGCLGPGCKVIGGYDFVRGDANPADDHGHGTHVAGIVAANGALKGVAPDARLLAYKVLDAGGTGWASDIIAGIEQAVLDGAHVINLSLGGPGDPDDPMSRAVDTAARAGIVVCVAAGNRGRYDGLISPGVARRALTVGAADKHDLVQAFSSRGPATATWQIKPNVMAPGAGIVSTVPSGGCVMCDPTGYVAASGTSMATPHVAGAAALLRSRFPAWTSDQVKAALAQPARPLGHDVFTQGSGRVDAYAAATIPVSASVSDLSFGIDDPALATFSRTIAVRFTNWSTVEQPVDLTVTSRVPLPAGLRLTVIPRAFTLAPGASRTVSAAVAIDNARVPNVHYEPHAYEGVIVADAGGRRLRYPFAVLKTPVLAFAFDEAPEVIWLHNPWSFFKGILFPGRSRQILLPADTYAAHVMYGDFRTTVVRENVPVHSTTRLDVAKAEANLKVSIEPVKPGGEPLDPEQTLLHTGFTYPNGYKLHSYFGVGQTRADFAYSPLSAGHRFEAELAEVGAEYGRPSFLFRGYFRDGLSESVVFRNAPSDLRKVVLEHATDPGVGAAWIRTWLGGPQWAVYHCNGRLPGLPTPLREEIYFVPRPYVDVEDGYVRKNVYRTDPDCFVTGDGLMYSSAFFGERSTRAVELRLEDAPFGAGSRRLPLGIGPYRWFGKFSNDPTAIRLSAARGTWLRLFLGQLGDLRPHDPLPYRLYRDGTLVRSDSFAGVGSFDGPGPGTVSVPVTPGRYRLRIPFDRFHVGARPGRAVASATFDTSLGDPNPPTLEEFSIKSDGVWSDTIRRGAANRLRFSASDASAAPTLAAHVRTAEGWTAIALTRTVRGTTTVGTAEIPAPAGAVRELTLRIRATDASGNDLTYETNLAVAD